MRIAEWISVPISIHYLVISTKQVERPFFSDSKQSENRAKFQNLNKLFSSCRIADRMGLERSVFFLNVKPWNKNISEDQAFCRLWNRLVSIHQPLADRTVI